MLLFYQAHERQGQALTGMEIASNVVGDLVTDRELKRMITEAGGQGDDPITAALKDAIIAEASQVAVESARHAREVVSNAEDAEYLGRGPSFVRSARQQREFLENNCDGPKRGIRVPGLGFIALGFGRAVECGSVTANAARKYLDSARKYFPALFQTSHPENPAK